MIKEVDVDGDGRIDFFEFVHALGEPESSQDCDDEDDESSAPSVEQPEKTSFIKTVITSPVESPVTAIGTLSALISSTDAQPQASSHEVIASQFTTRPTGRKLNAPKTRLTRPYRSISPEPTSLEKPQTSPQFERLRSPSLKEAGSLNFLAQKAQERRPSLRTCYVSDEVARISRASFRESYNAIAKPNQKSDSPSPGEKSPFALDFSSLESLRESYKKLACLTNDLNGKDSEESDEQLAGRRGSANSLRLNKSAGVNAAEQSFDIESDMDFEQSDGDVDDLDADLNAPSYQAIPGFGKSAFYLSKVQLDYPNG